MVLKSVHEFVTEYMVRLLVGHSERENHAVAQSFRHAARTDADVSLNRIRLLETRMVVVNDQRVFLLERIAQHSLVHGIPEFGGCHEFVASFGVVQVFVNDKMRRFHHFKIKLLVMGFVAPEILGRCGLREASRQQQGKKQNAFHGYMNLGQILVVILFQSSRQHLTPKPP